tara:strand:+ start:98 stop:997 length:900 start_codon:yes stop_codon:yes gene_type:complete
MKVKYIIPSYNRAELLCQTTLKLLNKNGIGEVSVLISKKQYDMYKKELATYNFDTKIHLLTTEEEGIGNIRNLIREMYGEGTNVLMIDDDIKEVCIKDDESGELIELENISGFVQMMFRKCEKEDIYMWGVQLHTNPYFMHKAFTTGLNYINGSFTGIRIEHTKRKIRTNMNHFEDYLFSILHFVRDKNVLKASNVCLKTKCFNTAGGICNQLGGLKNRRVEAVTNGTLLELHFGDLLYLKHSKKYNVLNIKLKKVKWRENFLELWDSWDAHTNPRPNEEIVLDNITKDVQNWDITVEA